jgi:phosphate transport system protein
MDTEHIVKSYDEDLRRLENMIAEMGGMAEMQLADAVEALVRFDTDAAAEIVKRDKRIDALEMEIDDFIIKLMALRQPLAEDLRNVITGLKISSNLERIGDYSKNIAKRTSTLSQSSMTPVLVKGPIGTISRMARIVQEMIKNVLDAYIARDADKADDVRAKDEEVDQLHSSLFRELLTYMMEDPRNITPCTHLMFVAKNVERMGDHVTGIAEQVHFMVHGALPDEERIKGDSTSSMMVELSDVNISGKDTIE